MSARPDVPFERPPAMVQEPKFQTYSDRLPPQNIDAEEAILGGILLDPEAINRVMEILRPEAFYITAHQQIYRGALALHSQGRPTDLMSISAWLKDQNLLDQVGGQNRLAQLVDRTISAVNIDQYASLVMDKYIRRKLIQVGSQITHLGFEGDTPLEKILDQAEQQVFGITQDRPQQGLTATSDILTFTFSDIESRAMGMVLPGISCGFYDLDAMTQGFQRSDLIIAAGRPSMGKCLSHRAEILLADGSVTTIAEIYRRQQATLLTLQPDWTLALTQPSAYVDDGLKPVFRVTTRLGRSLETTLTHPYLTLTGWKPLSDLQPGALIAVPRRLPIFGRDRVSETQLQTWADDIEQTTDSKLPAAVFRLTRSHLAAFLQRVWVNQGWATVLSNGRIQVGYRSQSETLARQLQHCLLRFGIVARLQQQEAMNAGNLEPHWHLDITERVSLQTFVADIACLEPEEAIAQVPTVLAQQQAFEGSPESDSSTPSTTLTATLALPEPQSTVSSDVYWDEIISIEPLGLQQVYDLTIPETHNFIANDICVHNTSFVLNIARNIAAIHKLPVAIYSLEMSKEQLVYRLLSSEVSIESGRLRSGRISQNEWEPLGHSISALSQLPIFIDDTPNISVTEMRSKARRLQAERGGALGLILIDYLQLMEGGGDNRVQELSKITRALKGLARELSVPVIALSQLSRGVESRTNKRPMMSDLRESGCLTGDTLIPLADSGRSVPLRDLIGQQGFKVWAINPMTLKLEKAAVSHAFSTGIKPVFKLKTRLGRSIRATGNHKFLTIDGWRRLDQLQPSDRIALPRRSPSPATQTLKDAEIALLGHLIGDGCTLPRHAIQYTTREPDLAETVASLAIEVFGEQVQPRIVRERGWYQVYLASSYRLTHKVRNPVATWLDAMGAFGLRSYEKFVPDLIFEQPQAAIALFLKHLWSTDGCIKASEEKRCYPAVYYASSSQRLAYDVQTLLLRLDINARLSVHPQVGKGRDQYHVTLSGKPDLEKFIRLVGALGAYKQQALQKLEQYLELRSPNTNRDVIPREVWRKYAVPAMQQSGLTNRQMQAQLGNRYCGTTLYQSNLSRDRAEKLARVVNSLELSCLSDSDVYWDEITAIEPDGIEEVFDLTVPGPHNFIANNIVVHNSIEQDADLIMMLYREEYYEPDTPDRGIAEVIITKHRNGPVGTVRLLFEPQFTRFRNLASPNRG